MAERHQQRRLHIQAAVKRMSKVRKKRYTPQHADPRQTGFTRDMPSELQAIFADEFARINASDA